MTRRKLRLPLGKDNEEAGPEAGRRARGAKNISLRSCGFGAPAGFEGFELATGGQWAEKQTIAPQLLAEGSVGRGEWREAP